MRFYLERIERDEVVFLRGKDGSKAAIKDALEKLVDESKMNSKIQLAVGLWKHLFEAAMSQISPNKRGYDKIFKYFDSYVEFEELIFASDSFYRDHTLHCLWVYFLGEYLYNNPEFSELYKLDRDTIQSYRMMDSLTDALHIIDGMEARKLKAVLRRIEEAEQLQDAGRCIAALTHDLGYPLKKIEKINKSINKVLPYFAIHNFDNFSFEYENIQQEFVNQFIDFLSRDVIVNINPKEDLPPEAMAVLEKLIGQFNGDDMNEFRRALEELPEDEKTLLKNSFQVDVLFHSAFGKRATYYNDFEAYQHGIMSAFLLMKNLQVFQNVDYCREDWLTPLPDVNVLMLHQILSTISNHTNDTYQIAVIDSSSFLTFVDELEEFSRISRASQNREYVEEFCDTALYMEDGWLNVVFEFNNTNLDNLDPEISFKGRCKRFLSLFDIAHLDPYLKIRVTIVGKLPTDQNEYVLEIAKNHADIRINGESKDIPKYLKSTQYFTKEEYAQMK
jgi:hypothetical protein